MKLKALYSKLMRLAEGQNNINTSLPLGGSSWPHEE